MEQPAGLLGRIRQAGWVYECTRAQKGAKAGKRAAWKKDHPGMMKTIREVRKLREQKI